MSQRGPFSPAQFTRESAERIANVVRAAEIRGTPAATLVFRRIPEASSKKQTRVGVFTGAWPKDTNKTVTLLNSTQTITVTNILFPNVGDISPSKCILAREGTAWYLANVEHSLQPLMFDAHLTPTSLDFDRVNVVAIKQSAVSVAISVATCATASS